MNHLDRQRLLHYAYMRFARDLDTRFAMLLRTGRLSKWYSQIGSEATTVAAGLCLRPGDVLSSLHRDLGAILAVYLDPARTFPDFGFGEPDGLRPEPQELLYRLCCQLLGRGDGFTQGVERSFHYGYLDADRGIRHIGMISHLGSMIPVAAGAAFALKQAGTDRLALNFIGDGGTSTGDFHEGLNMAAVWKLPLILVIENNRYAFSTPTSAQYAADKLSDRGVGYGIAAETVDGNDPESVSAAMARAVARARSGAGPTLIEAMLGRMRGHSEGDDSLKVVPKDELEVYMREDPVHVYAERLATGVLAGDLLPRLEARISELVEEAVARAVEAPDPDIATARRPALAPLDQPIVNIASPTPEDELDFEIPRDVEDTGEPQPETYVEGIHQALREELERDDQVVLMGQDIAAFEGAFRITRGLWKRWPERVLDTPIAESGTLGIAAGAALLGYRPVIEMQFGDFISCGFNQMVNVIAKFFYRWQVPCPLVVRLPAGGGVGAGPFHSQNPEAWFAHVAGLKVVCPATAEDAKALLKAAIRDPNPVVFCEHKFLYRRIKAILPEADEVAELGVAAVRRPGVDLTMVGYGAAVWTCLEAAETLAEEGFDVEVIDLRTLVPLDEATVLASVRRTGRALVVHEAQETAGFGGEIAARVADQAFAWLDAPVKRVAYPDRAVPFAKKLEQELLPSTDKVLAAARELLTF
ncbi:MAG: dehydrogenase E1 component subunit alpha/beta [Acidobacteriota bacterium]